MKEIIKSFDALEEGGNKFIIAEIGDRHLFVKTDKVEFVQKKVKEYSDALHFEPKKDQ